MLYDLDPRFPVMDKYEPIRQVLTLGRVLDEHIAETPKAQELARLANNGMAELVVKHPERFVAPLTTISMTDIDAALEETDRTIGGMRFRGVYLHTPVDEKPIDLRCSHSWDK
jgi:predicted TIM-barrel fold metal-dependent hydrolase